MPHFAQAKPTLSARYQDKDKHGGNHAPSVADWFKNDDTLDRQGVSPGRPNGHGICKGIASSWVIAFLNNVADATDPKRYETYYTNFLRFQATMVKDFGGHIDAHADQFKKIGMGAGIKEIKQASIVKLGDSDVPGAGRWGAYISCWHHDIAAGGLWGMGSKLYINEPNTGLLGYDDKTKFLADLDAYLNHRRNRKRKPATEPAGFWIYKAG
jgi:hypothetical protein